MEMAIVTIPALHKTLTEEAEIRSHLASIGVGYERWTPAHPVADDASQEEILAAYALEIERLKTRGGYVTADVIDVSPETPGLGEMLTRFNREHWHDEDEVRFVTQGRGIFHIRSAEGLVTAVEMASGDLLTVPRGTLHWFDLCADRRIRAIRLFQDPGGWTPYYTESGMEHGYQPGCFGLAYIAPQNAAI
jgi:1,2-dihydroxy-3-keto-5-methylthiopentene dioxygenase